MSRTIALHKNLSKRDAIRFALSMGLRVGQRRRGGHVNFNDPITGESWNRSKHHKDAGQGLLAYLRRAARARGIE